MPEFSNASLRKLETCEADLQTLFKTVIKHRDCTIVSGMRTPEEQNKLYRQGRETPGNIVTYKDGYDRKSKHNYNPSKAVDAIPYPVDWTDIEGMKEFGSFVLGVAKMLKEYGAIEHDIKWGGDWTSFKDYPHYEI